MADILKKAREDLLAEAARKTAHAKAEAIAKKKKEAEEKVRREAYQKAQLAREKDAAAEKRIEAAVAQKISAADSALQKAFNSIAAWAPKLLTYKHETSNDGATHELTMIYSEPLRIGVRPVFNGQSGVNKKLTSIELYVDDLLNAEKKEGETRERVTEYGESFGLYTEPWEIEYTKDILHRRTIYSAPSNEAIASALEKWFAAAVKENRYLADAVKSGKISGSINIGLRTPAEKPTKRTEWAVTGQRIWREKTSEYDRHHPFGL